MPDRVLGLHHITAIASSAQRNHEFYTKLLGLRLVKKTVNFDDPETYHLYYGNEIGSPGTILTFFPWQNTPPGHPGTGMATEIGFSVPGGSLELWKSRFDEYNVKYTEPAERFNEQYLSFNDPDGLKLNFIEPKKIDNRIQWETTEIIDRMAVKGFHSVTLTLKSIEKTAEVLTDIFGYTLAEREDNRSRFVTDAVEAANIVDLVGLPNERTGHVAGGTNHHVAFRIVSDEVLMSFREKILSKGFNITPKIDRNYFFSLYFREPGGVLFELASDNPGFTVDESANELGTHLKLPGQYEPYRKEIEKVLPSLEK